MLLPEQLIAHYDLQPHPEGGYFRETYRSPEQIGSAALPERFGGARAFSTAIYFLLVTGDFSAFHKLQSDECWHFYAGDSLLVHILQPGGKLETVRLGSNVEKGEKFQYVVPANCWFASEPAEDSRFAFTGCTVAPGFDYADFEMASFDELSAQYPQHRAILRRLCRRGG